MSIDSDPPPIHLYKERWLVVFVVTLLQIASSIMWMSFPSIANIAAVYYNVDLDAVNWLTDVTYLVHFACIFPGMWLLNTYGMLPVVYIVNGCAIIGGGIRLFGTFEFVPNVYRFPITMVGQIIASITFPLLMLLPTHISQSWFPDRQRAMSTSITSMSTYIGGMIGGLLGPYLSSKPSELYVMNGVYCVTTIAIGIVGFTIRHNAPPTPPYIVSLNPSDKHTLSFIKNLKTKYAAIFSALIQGTGAFVSPLITYVIGKRKCYDEIVKIFLAIEILLSIAVSLVMRLENMEIAIGILGTLLGIIAFTATPICLELSVETCYPTNEGIAGSFFWISSQIQSAVIFPVMTASAPPLSQYRFKRETCTLDGSVKAFDLTYSTLAAIGFFILQMVAVLIWCRPKYKRMEAEKLSTIKSPSVKTIQSMIIMQIDNMEAVIAILAAMLGMVTFPVCMELGSNIFSGPPLQLKRFKLQTCLINDNSEAYDLIYSCLVALGLFTIELIALVIWCEPKYNRIKAKKLVAKDQLALKSKKEEKRTTIRF
ncbi:hypothetical protein CHUAL_008217 [Chamberlinius hualienensis]